MTIVRRRDPFSLFPRWAWPAVWEEEDFIPEGRDLTLYETDDDVVVEANVAGVPASQVDVSLEGGTVTIKAEHEESEEKRKKKKAVYRQARAARYYYTASMPCPVKADQAKAEIRNGILTVTVPKEEKAKPKKVKVKAQEK
jgi:HSP20 family protein